MATAAAPADSQCDLPKNVVKRIVKEKLAGLPGGKADLQINKEALLAFGESAKVFISFITATANDVCKEKKRSTINADDVFQALEDLEFADLLPALKESFEAYKEASKEKKEKKAEVTRKRKSQAQEGDAAAAAAGAAAGDEAAAEEPADTTAASDKSGGDAAGPRGAAGRDAAGDVDMEDAAAEDGEGDADAAAGGDDS